MPSAPHVLVIRRRYLGDVVLLGSLLRNIRLAHPDATIDVLVDPGYAPILALNPDVNSVVSPPDGLLAWVGFLRELRRRQYTHVFNFDNTERTALITRASGAALRVALHHGGHRIKWPKAYTHVVHDTPEDHESRPITEYYLLALGPAGIPVATREIRIVPREAELARYRKLVGASGRILLVHPGSRSPFRLWPAESFAAVCDRVQDELDTQVILVGGPAETELIGKIRGLAKSHILALAESPTLPEFAALASLSTVLLCHDSGPMHVAAAVGLPVVALYGSQNAVLFSPVGTGHTLLTPPLPCTTCVAVGKCLPEDSYRNYCVRRHTVEQVFEAVKASLSQAISLRS